MLLQGRYPKSYSPVTWFYCVSCNLGTPQKPCSHLIQFLSNPFEIITFKPTQILYMTSLTKMECVSSEKPTPCSQVSFTLSLRLSLFRPCLRLFKMPFNKKQLHTSCPQFFPVVKSRIQLYWSGSPQRTSGLPRLQLLASAAQPCLCPLSHWQHHNLKTKQSTLGAPRGHFPFQP